MPCGQTDMMQQIATFQNFVNAPKNIEAQCEVFYESAVGWRNTHVHTAYNKLSVKVEKVKHVYRRKYSGYS